MKSNNEIIKGILSTFEKADCKLSEDQEAVLHGSLHIWLEQVRTDEKIKFIDDLKMYIQKQIGF